MRIVIPDDYQDVVRRLECFQLLKGHEVTVYHDTVKDVETLAARFAGAEALVLIRERTAISDALLERLPSLKLISQTGRGMPHIDLEACARRGVTVVAGGGSPYAPAELTWALVLASRRELPKAVEAMRAGRWQTTFGYSLYGRTLGILGYGQIGKLVAGYGQAFGMQIMVWGRDGSRSRAQADGLTVAASQRDLFAQADVLSVHLKLNAETRGIITHEDLAVMKPDALFVNTSRAELVESGALAAALRAGKPGYGAVDVYESEPVYSHELLTLDNALCTPHLGYVERDSYEQYFEAAFTNVLTFAAQR